MNDFLGTPIGRVVELLVILAITVGFSFLERYFYKKYYPKIKKKGMRWESALVRSFHGPLQVFIWLAGASLAVDASTNFFEIAKVQEIFTTIRKIGGGILGIWFLANFIKETEAIMMEKREGKSHLDKTTVRGVGQILRVILIFIGLIIVLQTVFGISASGLIAVAGGGGLTIGFAAKEMISNFFGGLMIFLDRPFAIGDWIYCREKDFEGFVEEIGWRLTRIRTFDRRPLYVPNSIFLTALIENPSRMTNRRIKATIGLRYKDAEKLPRVIEDTKAVIAEREDIDQKRPIYVNFINFGTSSLDLYVSCYTTATKRAEYLNAQQKLFFQILDIVKQNGAECAFPTTTIDLPDAIKMES